MLVDSGNSAAGSAVTGAIRQASQATGTSFNYLLATAQVESGLNPQAGASTSSARGLFQFIDTTWLATMKQYGPALGYGRYADASPRTPPAIMWCAIRRRAARSSNRVAIRPRTP
jgi:soluble lytic murein transglycosylase-like protein